MGVEWESISTGSAFGFTAQRKPNRNDIQADYSSRGQAFSDLRSTDAPDHELQRSDAFGGESSPPSGSRAKGDGLDAPLSQLRVGGRNLGIHHLRSTGTHHR